MRITVDAFGGIRNADVLKHLDRMRARLFFGVAEVKLRYLHQLFRHAHERIQRSHRILKNHRDVTAPQIAQLTRRQFQNIAAIEFDCPAGNSPRRLGNQAHDRKVRDGLAGARLADDAQRLAALNFKADAVHGFDRAVFGVKVRAKVFDL